MENSIPGSAGNEFDLNDLAQQVAAECYTPDGFDDSEEIKKNLKRDIVCAFRKIGLALVNSEGHRMEIHGIGVFKLEHRAARKGTNPNGVPWETPERHEITFTAAPKFAGLIGEALGSPVY